MKKQTKTSVNSEYDGDIGTIISTGSTLLNLAISGGRVRGGGIPAGVLVEIFGPSGSGKTVLLCEIAGDVQRKGGEVKFGDPEARLNKQFAKMFDLDTDIMDYARPDTVTKVFEAVRKWEPKGKEIHGIFADSLTALSTALEMGDDGDKMGMRRAKEFSEELRKTCRTISQKNYLMMCSNQIRQTTNQFGPKYKSPGGEAMAFYSSLRLRTEIIKKIWKTQKVAGKDVKRVIGVKIDIEVFKSSIWKPYHTAPLTILFDYGIDDIRENIQFIKDYTKATGYFHDGAKLGDSMERAIKTAEGSGLEEAIKEEVIDLWEEIEHKFDSNRQPKKR